MTNQDIRVAPCGTHPRGIISHCALCKAMREVIRLDNAKRTAQLNNQLSKDKEQ